MCFCQDKLSLVTLLFAIVLHLNIKTVGAGLCAPCGSRRAQHKRLEKNQPP